MAEECRGGPRRHSSDWELRSQRPAPSSCILADHHDSWPHATRRSLARSRSRSRLANGLSRAASAEVRTVAPVNAWSADDRRAGAGVQLKWLQAKPSPPRRAPRGSTGRRELYSRKAVASVSSNAEPSCGTSSPYMRVSRPDNFVPLRTARAHAPSPWKPLLTQTSDSPPPALLAAAWATDRPSTPPRSSCERPWRAPRVFADERAAPPVPGARACQRIWRAEAVGSLGISTGASRVTTARGWPDWCRTGRGTCTSTRGRVRTVYRLVRSVSSSRFWGYVGLGVCEQTVRLEGPHKRLSGWIDESSTCRSAGGHLS